MEEPMRRTSTDKKINRKKKRAIQLVTSALAVTVSLAGGSALADHKGYNHDHYDRGYEQDHYRYGPIYRNYQQQVRVNIPVRDHGPETLPLGRLIMQNSNVDLHRYRLVAVVTKNGRFSNGYASLRTGNSKTQRYFLGSREKTHIPAPSRADRKWHLRLGPGTQIRSVTAVLEPRRHGWSHNTPANWRHASTYDRGHYRDRSSHQATQNTSLHGLAWLLANADDDNRDRKQAKRLKKLRAERARTEAELAATQRKLDRSRDRNKQLKDQRARLAEELAHERVEDRPGKRGKADDPRKGDRKRARKGERVTEREVKRTVRYVVSAK
jgi:hypothetical protein